MSVICVGHVRLFVMAYYLFCTSVCNAVFSSLAEVFCNTRDTSSAADLYLSYISNELSEFSLSNTSDHIAALIIEPGKEVFALCFCVHSFIFLFTYFLILMTYTWNLFI
jgi:hypothetical protein